MICSSLNVIQVTEQRKLNRQSMWHVWGERRGLQSFGREVKRKETNGEMRW